MQKSIVFPSERRKLLYRITHFETVILRDYIILSLFHYQTRQYD